MICIVLYDTHHFGMTDWMKGYKPIVIELKLDEYTLERLPPWGARYIRKDAWSGRTLKEMYELDNEPPKPNWVGKRWNDGRGEKKDGGWGFTGDDANDYIVKWI